MLSVPKVVLFNNNKKHFIKPIRPTAYSRNQGYKIITHAYFKVGSRSGSSNQYHKRHRSMTTA